MSELEKLFNEYGLAWIGQDEGSKLNGAVDGEGDAPLIQLIEAHKKLKSNGASGAENFLRNRRLKERLFFYEGHLSVKDVNLFIDKIGIRKVLLPCEELMLESATISYFSTKDNLTDYRIAGMDDSEEDEVFEQQFEKLGSKGQEILRNYKLKKVFSEEKANGYLVDMFVLLNFELSKKILGAEGFRVFVEKLDTVVGEI